jgi:hypothetical protein
VWARGDRAIGIEVKASPTWKPEHATMLKTLLAGRHLTKAHGVYTGGAELKDGPVRVWPINQFLMQLAAGEILG